MTEQGLTAAQLLQIIGKLYADNQMLRMEIERLKQPEVRPE